MYDILSLEKAKKIARKYDSIDHFLYGNGHGLIGSLAAVGTNYGETTHLKQLLIEN